jgi:hypothetical protein
MTKFKELLFFFKSLTLMWYIWIWFCTMLTKILIVSKSIQLWQKQNIYTINWILKNIMASLHISTLQEVKALRITQEFNFKHIKNPKFLCHSIYLFHKERTNQKVIIGINLHDCVSFFFLLLLSELVKAMVLKRTPSRFVVYLVKEVYSMT